MVDVSDRTIPYEQVVVQEEMMCLLQRGEVPQTKIYADCSQKGI